MIDYVKFGFLVIIVMILLYFDWPKNSSLGVEETEEGEETEGREETEEEEEELGYYTDYELYSLTDSVILARTIYGEARNCGTQEKYFVGQVVMHRIASIRWPGNLKNVVLQARQFQCWDIPQDGFSESQKMSNNYDTRSYYPVDGPAYYDCLSIAENILAGNITTNNELPGDVYYYFVYKPGQHIISENIFKGGGPSWAKDLRVYDIKKHLFLRE